MFNREEEQRSALKNAQERECAEAIVRAVPFPLINLEADFRVHFANDAFYQTFQTTPEETQGRSFFELENGQWNLPTLRPLLEEVIPCKFFFNDFEVVHTFEKIGKRTMLVNARLLQPSGAQPGRILLGIVNITGRARAEEAQQVLAGIVECSTDAILSKDLNGNILSWNQGAESLFSYTAKEAIGQPIYMIIPEQYHSDEKAILQKVMQGERVYHYETVRRRKDGRVVEVSLTASPLRDAADKIIGASTIARDISGHKRAEEALREAKERLASQASELERLVAERTAELTAANKNLEAFVYSIAHDLRAPLRAMQGFSTLLLEESGPALDERGRDFAFRISRSAGFMDTLLKDLLAFSHISQQRFQLAPVNLRAAAQKAISSLDREIQDKNAVLELAGDWPKVLAHESTLIEVLVNLISNALKFVGPGVVPAILLRAEEQDNLAQVWVEDNGIGIAPEHQERIFRIFTRLGGEAYPGTGIGLAIVHKGIEQMGGRVGVESTLGRGSRFWFELRKG